MSDSMASIRFRAQKKLNASVNGLKVTATQWMRQGASPQRLALTLALGFAIGCIPVVGIPTLVCAALAILLRLNLPAIQAANYIVMPLQILLIVPLVRFGGWLIASSHTQMLQTGSSLHAMPVRVASQMGWLAGQALLAWAVLAVPAVLLLTGALTLLLRRIPAFATAEAGD